MAEPLVPSSEVPMSRLKFRMLPLLGTLSVLAALLGQNKTW